MIALLAPLLVQAVAPVFAPTLDRPIAYTVSETRQGGARPERFAIDRQVVFRRVGDGFVAEVQTLRVTGQAPGAGPLFESMTRAMLGKTVWIRLDSAGRAIDVDGLDAIWDAQLAAMTGALASKEPARAAAVDALLAPLRSLPRAARVKRVAEMIAPLIVDRSFVPTPSRTITVSARGPDGAIVMLAGTERVILQPDRRLLLERDASGTVGASIMSQTLRRWIDVSTGLVIETRNVETITTAGGRTIITRSTGINPSVF